MKPLLEWNDDYSVNVDKLDDDHKKLFQLTNDFYVGIKKKAPISEINRLIKDLKSYTFYHFRTEEELMDKNNFPDVAAHKKEHDSFIEKIVNIEQRIQSRSLVGSNEIVLFLKNWLINHILLKDHKYRSYIKD